MFACRKFLKKTYITQRTCFLTAKTSSVIALFALLLLSSACHREQFTGIADHPRLMPVVAMHDVTFSSSALGRDMPYRVILPRSMPSGTKLPVVYLLHGGNGNYRDWSNNTDVARFAERGLILVMPDGDNAWYTNSTERPRDRYEDYITQDLVTDVEARFPAATGRANRAIVGISMGGFGAVKIALHRPELYAFVGGLSSALDAPGRPFSIARIGQYRHYRSIFGPVDGVSRRDNDPFLLAQSVDPKKMPYFFLTCGDSEGLLGINRTFARILQERHFPYEFHVVPGGHYWGQWNATLDAVFGSLVDHLHKQ